MLEAWKMRQRALLRRIEALEEDRDDLKHKLRRLEGKLNKGLHDLRRDLESLDEPLVELVDEEEEDLPLNRRT